MLCLSSSMTCIRQKGALAEQNHFSLLRLFYKGNSFWATFFLCLLTITYIWAAKHFPVFGKKVILCCVCGEKQITVEIQQMIILRQNEEQRKKMNNELFWVWVLQMSGNKAGKQVYMLCFTLVHILVDIPANIKRQDRWRKSGLTKTKQIQMSHGKNKLS